MLRKMMISLMMVGAACMMSSLSWSQTPAVDIQGQWQSEQPEGAEAGPFGWREFTITEKEWEVSFTMYADKEKTMPVFTFRAVGPYEIQDKSATVEGAFNAIFRFAKKFVTLKTDNADVIKNLGFDACGLTKDAEQDISETGCSFLTSVAACGQEYDLVKIADGKFYLGARPADGNMCTEDRRPTALNLPLVKVDAAK